MTTNKPNLYMLAGIVSEPTLNRLRKGGRLKQKSAFKRIALELRSELWDTEETRQILEAIEP